MYRCPLCLKELSSRDNLLRYCHACNEVSSFKFSAENVKNLVKCKNPNCSSDGKIAEGVYLSHQKCKALNPFWKTDKFEIPDSLVGEQVTLNFDKIGLQTFIHWENKMLGRISRIGEKSATDDDENKTEGISESPTPEESIPNASESSDTTQLKGKSVRWMFFPNLLLRATGEINPDNEKRFGRLVALAGVPGAGKTILAFQALTRRGYLQPRSEDKIEIEDFIYSFPKEAAVQSIFELLYIKSLMRDNQPFTEPESTVTKSNNLYTIFIKPTEKVFEKKNSLPEPILPENIEGKVEPDAEGVISRIWNFIKRNARRMYEAYNRGPQTKKEIAKPFWFTLALYDVAGEDDNIIETNIETNENSVDKVALVIDATDFIKREEDSNLARTVRRLNRLRQNSKPFCVVLTKMDLFIKNFENPDLFLPDGMLDNKRSYYSNQAEIKKFLVDFKQFCEKIESGSYPHNLSDLLSALISLKGSENPIFLLENTNLTDTPNAEVKQMPVSIGLDAFVCWCLEIERDDIIESY
jgi:hypothetical protein